MESMTAKNISTGDTAMYKRLAAAVICISSLFMSSVAMADGWNYGFKVLYFETDDDSDIYDDPDNVGFLLGYDWDKDYGTLGLEVDYTTTFEDGRATPIGPDVSVDTAGIYATYKTSAYTDHGLGFYFKLKGGVTYYDLEVGPLAEDDSDTSLGAGIGMNMGMVSFEFEFVTVEESEMITFTMLF